MSIRGFAGRCRAALKQKLLWALRSSAARKSSLLRLLGSRRGQSHLCKQLGFLCVMSNGEIPSCPARTGSGWGLSPCSQGGVSHWEKAWNCLGMQSANQTGVKLQFCISKVCPVVLPLTDCWRWKQSSRLHLALRPPTKPSLAWQQKKQQISAAAPPPLPPS